MITITCLMGVVVRAAAGCLPAAAEPAAVATVVAAVAEVAARPVTAVMISRLTVFLFIKKPLAFRLVRTRFDVNAKLERGPLSPGVWFLFKQILSLAAPPARGVHVKSFQTFDIGRPGQTGVNGAGGERDIA